MDLLELINNRHSYRGEYENTPVPRENLIKIMEADLAAPAIICVLTQRINAYRDKCYATQDYSATIENMLLAIVALGYQSCWYEGHITDEDRIGDQMAKILGVPDDYELVCFLPVGIAKSGPKGPKKKSLRSGRGLIGLKQSKKEHIRHYTK